EPLGLGVKSGGKIFLVGTDAAGDGGFHPFLRAPLETFEHGLPARRDIARDEAYGITQLALVEEDRNRIIAGRRVEEAGAERGRGGSGKRINAAVLLVAHDSRAASRKIVAGIEDVGGQQEGDGVVTREDCVFVILVASLRAELQLPVVVAEAERSVVVGGSELDGATLSVQQRGSSTLDPKNLRAR